jgi:hypothetical protein
MILLVYGLKATGYLWKNAIETKDSLQDSEDLLLLDISRGLIPHTVVLTLPDSGVGEDIHRSRPITQECNLSRHVHVFEQYVQNEKMQRQPTCSETAHRHCLKGSRNSLLGLVSTTTKVKMKMSPVPCPVSSARCPVSNVQYTLSSIQYPISRIRLQYTVYTDVFSRHVLSYHGQNFGAWKKDCGSSPPLLPRNYCDHESTPFSSTQMPKLLCQVSGEHCLGWENHAIRMTIQGFQAYDGWAVKWYTSGDGIKISPSWTPPRYNPVEVYLYKLWFSPTSDSISPL